MEAIIYQKSYQEYKQELDGVLQQTAEGFVRIGYLLKVARDTNILAESGYSSVVEFAQAEYNIDKTQVSRFIHINDKFAEGGYSDRLEERYQGFGYAKLTLMLQLQEEINEELTPEYSKAEIQALKEEVDAEKQVSDLEVLMEEKPEEQEEMILLERVIHQLGNDMPDLFEAIWAKGSDGFINADVIKEILAPSGEKIYSVRIMGTGRVMLSLKDTDDEVSITPVRAPQDKEWFTWEDIAECIGILLLSDNEADTVEEAYKNLYGEEFPKKEEIAPVQPKKETLKKPEQKKQSKVEKVKPVQKTLNDIDPEIPKPEPVEKTECEADSDSQAAGVDDEGENLPIPGQDDIMNHPEYLPEDKNEEIAIETTGEELSAEPESVEKTECEADSDSPAAVMEDMTEAEWENTWNTAKGDSTKLNIFFHRWDNSEAVPEEEMRTAYAEAVDLAASLERMINGKKYHA